MLDHFQHFFVIFRYYACFAILIGFVARSVGRLVDRSIDSGASQLVDRSAGRLADRCVGS